MEPELIADYRCNTGENPLWNPLEKRVYWTDIPAGKLFRYDPATGHHEQFFSGDPVGGFTLQADGSLLLFQARGAVRIWKNGQLTTLIEELEDERDSRFNDVIADPEGRVFAGTMPTQNHKGSVYRLDLDGSIRRVIGGTGTANGMGFTLDRQRMYFTDSTAREIYEFDYDQSSGEITNRRLHIAVPKEEGEGVPDGMTMDSEGYLWSARWDGYCLVRYTPDGQEDRRIRFATKKVSSVTFGGDDYADMYFTTAGGDKKEENGPDAGALFRLRPGIRGLPEYHSRIGL